jgi:hypothetical protein
MAALLSVPLIAACGGDRGEGRDSPLAPSAAASTLQIGDYDVQLTGVFCGGVVPPVPSTGPAPVSSTPASVRVTVSRDGSAWVVRSSTADDGDFSMRLSEVYAGQGFNAVTGTISGRAVDQRGFAGSGPLTVTLSNSNGGTVVTSGSLKTTPPAYLYETIGLGSGTSRFELSGRDRTETCQQFAWGIRPRID